MSGKSTDDKMARIQCRYWKTGRKGKHAIRTHTSIALSESLLERIRKFPEVNWSLIARERFEQILRKLEGEK